MYLLTLWLSRLAQNSFLSQRLPYTIPSVDLWIQSFHIITISSIVHMPLRFCHSNWLYFSMKCLFKLQIVTIHELYPVSGLHPIFSINTCLLTAHIYLYIYLFIYFCQWVCEKIAKISTKNNRPITPQLPGITMKICRTKGNKTVDNVLTGGTCRQPTSGVLNWERWVVSSSMCAGNHPTVHNISSTVCFSLGRI